MWNPQYNHIYPSNILGGLPYLAHEKPYKHLCLHYWVEKEKVIKRKSEVGNIDKEGGREEIEK